MNGTKVTLKKQSEYIGIIEKLWLPADEDSYRKFDLWYVKWNCGTNGIVELKDLIIIDKK